ncbi:AAA family ATPase [Methylopila sp. Yamaguchi]|uniref:AAA family ATPase n=1 Tax=Methylopila sp. Yamaguchi TaxID=1437817 RepID=UPI000CBD552E|nr:MoxR family ATPase [Methylopila sp. Yamaguchi]GBD48772.1 MxaR protein [Methylopila sp. Yamaguchi]
MAHPSIAGIRNEPAGAASLERWREQALAFEAEVGRAVVGQPHVVRLLTIAIFARGHVLLEGDVGVGKTTILRAVARALGGPFERIEGTVDLMPTDMLYTAFVDDAGKPRVEPGPVLHHGENLAVFFFNEINRARPQVHSLLLRLMAERSVTAFGNEWSFPHLQVFADRNRVEKEETFELPAAARDRFLMEIGVETPTDVETRRELVFDPRFHDVDRLIGSLKEGVLDHRGLGEAGRAIQETITTSPTLETYVLALWDAIRAPLSVGIAIDGVDMARLIQGGGSPRGVGALVRAARVRAWLEGRAMVLPEDVRAVFNPVMAHRIFLDPIYEARRDRIVAALCAQVFERTPAP